MANPILLGTATPEPIQDEVRLAVDDSHPAAGNLTVRQRGGLYEGDTVLKTMRDGSLLEVFIVGVYGDEASWVPVGGMQVRGKNGRWRKARDTESIIGPVAVFDDCPLVKRADGGSVAPLADQEATNAA